MKAETRKFLKQQSEFIKNKMKKYIIISLIVILFLAPFISHALPPIWVDDGGDTGGTGGTSGTGESGTGGTSPINTTSSPDLFVDTIKSDSITQNSATLYGEGGYKTSDGDLSRVTAYFRYAKATDNPPIFCNDIYGSNMVATGDKFLTEINKNNLLQSFSQQVTGLSPNTTYYYCAIVSNKDNIAYGGEDIVKQFHTNCYDTTVTTKDAINIKSSSAKLNGTYCSPKNNFDGTITNTTATTYFEYREKIFGGVSPAWATASGSEKLSNMGNNSNLYGNINFNLTKLKPNTEYQFRAVVKNNTGVADETTHPATNILSFTTKPSAGGGVDIVTPPKTCVSPYILNTSTNTCVNPTDTGDRTWGGENNGTSGTWTSGSGTGTWIATTGTGGTGTVTWYSNGIWTSATGSGTWTRGTNPPTNTGNLSLGQTATPPNDAIVRYHEGVETVFARQIVANQTLAQTYGYTQGSDLQTFAWYLADEFAKMFGYIDENGKEIRVSFPDVAAYQLLLTGNTLTVYEYYNNRIVDIRNINTAFKNASDYEYYFKK